MSFDTLLLCLAVLSLSIIVAGTTISNVFHIPLWIFGLPCAAVCFVSVLGSLLCFSLFSDYLNHRHTLRAAWAGGVGVGAGVLAAGTFISAVYFFVAWLGVAAQKTISRHLPPPPVA